MLGGTLSGPSVTGVFALLDVLGDPNKAKEALKELKVAHDETVELQKAVEQDNKKLLAATKAIDGREADLARREAALGKQQSDLADSMKTHKALVEKQAERLEAAVAKAIEERDAASHLRASAEKAAARAETDAAAAEDVRKAAERMKAEYEKKLAEFINIAEREKSVA